MHVFCLLARIYIFIVYLPVCVYANVLSVCTSIVCVYVYCLCFLCCLCAWFSVSVFFVTLSVCGVIAIMQVSMYLSAGVHICLSRYICLFHHAQGICSNGSTYVMSMVCADIYLCCQPVTAPTQKWENQKYKEMHQYSNTKLYHAYTLYSHFIWEALYLLVSVVFFKTLCLLSIQFNQ